MHQRFFSALLGAATAAVWPFSVARASVALPAVRVADTSTVIPAGSFAGKTFSAFTSSGVVTPPVMNQGYVEFIGAPAGVGSNGVFTWHGGPSQLLADPSVPRPGPSTPFSSFRYPAKQGRQSAFSNYDAPYTTTGRP